MGGYFPKRFVNTTSLQYYGRLKERTLAVLKYLVSEDDSQLEKIDEMTLELQTMMSPMLLDGTPESYMIGLEKEQSQLYAGIEEMGIANPEQLTLLRFYSLIEKKEGDKIRGQQNVKQNGKGRI